jgi:hypothetical protein
MKQGKDQFYVSWPICVNLAGKVERRKGPSRNSTKNANSHLCPFKTVLIHLDLHSTACRSHSQLSKVCHFLYWFCAAFSCEVYTWGLASAIINYAAFWFIGPRLLALNLINENWPGYPGNLAWSRLTPHPQAFAFHLEDHSKLAANFIKRKQQNKVVFLKQNSKHMIFYILIA